MKKQLRPLVFLLVLVVSVVLSACAFSTNPDKDSSGGGQQTEYYNITRYGLTLTLPQTIKLIYNPDNGNFESADGSQAITITQYDGDDFNYYKLAERIKAQGYNRVFAMVGDEFAGVRFEGYKYWACYLTNGTNNYGVVFYNGNSTPAGEKNSAVELCIIAVMRSEGVEVLR